ncbi:MAG TPA: hypothetical protein VN893_03990, partial [Bryobacteraceae bacterium]|nr:hypothetical protein [Bryobacteraceae bacterium]
ALAGLAAAALVLTNVAAVVVALCWTLYLAARMKRAVPFLGVFALAMALGCAPWAIRNYRVFHQVVLVRDSLGMELYVSNNDCAGFSQDASIANGCHARTHPTRSLAEAELLVRLGEVRYNQYRLATATDWIRTHPRRFAALAWRRFVSFWLPADSLPIVAITCLSLGGFLLMAIRKIPALAFIAAVMALYPLIYYVVQTIPRYRYPILWLSLLGAGYALSEWTAAARERLLRMRRGVLGAGL